MLYNYEVTKDLHDYKKSSYKPGNNNYITKVEIADKNHASIIRDSAYNKWGVILLVDTEYDLPMDTWIEREFRRIECFDSQQEAQIYCDIHNYQVVLFDDYIEIAKALIKKDRDEFYKKRMCNNERNQ